MSAISDILGGCDSKTMAIAIAIVIIIALIIYGLMMFGMMKSRGKEGLAPVRKIAGGYNMGGNPFNPDSSIKYSPEGFHDWEGLRKNAPKLSYENFKTGHDVNPVDLFDIAYGLR